MRADSGKLIVSVADLVGALAGLPPMMDVFLKVEYIDRDGHYREYDMYVTGAEVFEHDRNPHFRIKGSVKPKMTTNYPETYDEKLEKQRNLAVNMSNAGKLEDGGDNEPGRI